jgi:hypothetical protein
MSLALALIVAAAALQPTRLILKAFAASAGHAVLAVRNGRGPLPTPVPAALPTPPALSGVVTTQTAEPTGPGVFFDCRSSATQAGTLAAPYRALDRLGTLSAGDHVYLRRGCSWPGALRVQGAGTASRPIVVEPYGSGVAPVLTGHGVSSRDGVVQVLAHFARVTGLHLIGAAGAAIDVTAPDATIEGIEIENAALGVQVSGPRAMVRRVYTHDLHMLVNTPGGTDDSGAVGYDVEASDVTIADSFCVNCRAKSYDFGWDGGFVEVWNDGDRLRVTGNTAVNTQGFLELGGNRRDASAVDIVVEGNLIENSHGGIWIHGDGEFAITTRAVLFDGNRLRSFTRDDVFGGDLRALVVQDNDVATPGAVSTSGPPGRHGQNRFYVQRPDDVGFALGPGESRSAYAQYPTDLPTRWLRTVR